jgi:hypothetical protein
MGGLKPGEACGPADPTKRPFMRRHRRAIHAEGEPDGRLLEGDAQVRDIEVGHDAVPCSTVKPERHIDDR